MLHVLLLYIGSEWPFRYITSNQHEKTDPKICRMCFCCAVLLTVSLLLHISPLPTPYILFLLSLTSPTTHLFPSPSPCFFSPLHHFTSSVFHSSSRVGFISSNKCPFLFLPFSSIHLLSSHAAGGEDGEARERDEIRHDRRKERQHDRNISRAAPDKRCCTRTLNTLHVNSSTSQYTHTHTHTHTRTAHCWIIHVASSNTEQTQQDPAHYSGSSPCLQWSTDCLCMCDARSVCVLCVCVCFHCQVGTWWNCGSLEERMNLNSEESSLQSQIQLSESRNLVILKLPFT